MLRNKLLLQVTKDQLIADFNELKSTIKIAYKYNVNIQTVYSAFKIINYNCRIRNDISSMVSKGLLEDSYARLKTLKAVARELKITPDSVKLYMDKFNLNYNKKIVYTCDHDFFSRENEETFYVAGFWAADGCVKRRKNTNNNIRYELQLSLSKNDEDHVKLIKNLLKAENPIHNFLIKNSLRNPRWNDTWCSQFTITSEKMVKDLVKFNIVPVKSLIYTFPPWIVDHPLAHHFMRGYNDGDGSFFIGNKKKITKQVNFALRGTAKFLTTYRHILEGKCNIDIKNTPIRQSSGTGILEYGGNIVVSKISEYLYKDATIYLPRKYEIAMRCTEVRKD